MDDPAIRAMLAERADRARPELLDVADLVAPIDQSRPRPAWQSWSVGLSTAAILIAASALLIALPRSIPVASNPAVVPVGPTGSAAPDRSTPPRAVAGTWPGGIPRSLEGRPVVVGLDAERALASATDASEILVGGPWLRGPTICLGRIPDGPVDPNPIALPGCPRYALEGVGRRFLFPDAMPTDQPVVLRVHTHDARAETCWDVEACRRVAVVDGVAWTLDDAALPHPLGPGLAVGQVEAIQFADRRKTGPNEFTFVDEDVFALPLACAGGWPDLTFSLHGDPRVRLLAVFTDPAVRAAFQASLAGSGAIRAAARCLDPAVPLGSGVRGLGFDNVLVLADTDDATAAEIQAQIENTTGAPRNDIPLPSGDLSRMTLDDFLAARGAGQWDHAWGERLSAAPSEQFDAYAEFQADSARRATAGALDGTITLLAADASASDVGPAVWTARPAGSRLWVYRVDYPGATDPALASETFVVIHDPASGYRDWTLVRLAGAPYPSVPIATPAPLPSGVQRPTPAPGSDGSGDTPCGPTPCGEESGG